VRYAFIERHREVWPIVVQCRVLEVSASGYRRHLGRRTAPAAAPGQRVGDVALLVHVRAIFHEMKGAYGWPRVWRELRDRDIRAGKERVRKMMKADGLRARGKRKFRVTTDSSHELPVSPNLLDRKFVVAEPNRFNNQLHHPCVLQPLTDDQHRENQDQDRSVDRAPRLIPARATRARRAEQTAWHATANVSACQSRKVGTDFRPSRMLSG